MMRLSRMLWRAPQLPYCCRRHVHPYSPALYPVLALKPGEELVDRTVATSRFPRGYQRASPTHTEVGEVDQHATRVQHCEIPLHNRFNLLRREIAQGQTRGDDVVGRVCLVPFDTGGMNPDLGVSDGLCVGDAVQLGGKSRIRFDHIKPTASGQLSNESAGYGAGSCARF